MWFNPAQITKTKTDPVANLANLRVIAPDADEKPAEIRKLAKFATQPNVENALALKVGAGETATTSRWWLIHFIERDPLELTCCPEATHAEILASYPDAIAAEPFKPSIRQPSSAITGDEEKAIRAWLALIEETDSATVAEVIGQCQRDADARAYFTGRAAAELAKPDPFPDDRITCRQCLNLRGRICTIAKPGGVVSANRGYQPPLEVLQRCSGYLPNATDTNQQPGGERWPSLPLSGVTKK